MACNRNHTPTHRYRTRSTRNESLENVAISADISDNETYTDNSNSSSDYSDWLSQSQQSVQFSPPRRSKRKIIKRKLTDKKNKQKDKFTIDLNCTNAIPEMYQPPKWLSEVTPWKTPYFPQMGDDVVYFRQGHQKYLEAVADKYNNTHLSKPWTKIHVKAQEFCKIIGIKYEIHPPRFCCLKLAMMDDDDHLTGESFTVKYHNMPDLHEFLVLKQTFCKALEQNWMIGMKFRCIKDYAWSFGKILSIEPLDKRFPDSYFMCYRVKWDNGDLDMLSPWNLESIDESNLLEELGDTVPVLPKEIRKLLYQPKTDEWPMGDRGVACRKIIDGLDQVMKLPIAESFVAPVDLNIYPRYAYVVQYPIDLSTIKARLENRFYRRITAVKFDIRYLAKNAEKFNERHSEIVKQARLVTDICLHIIKDVDKVIDVTAVYQHLLNSYCSSDSDIADVEETKRPSRRVRRCLGSSPRKGASTESSIDVDFPSTSRRLSEQSPLRRNSMISDHDWKVECKRLLQTLWNSKDSIPFREHVDPLECEDYNRIITTPMCLQSVIEDLEGGNYENPQELDKDVKLIFANSRKYYKNKNSEIYKQTTRMSNMFEEIMKPILSHWILTKRKNSVKKPIRTKKLKRAKIYSSNQGLSANAGNGDDENDESSYDEWDDSNDPTWVMDSQMTEESEEFSQVVEKLSQILTETDMTVDAKDQEIPSQCSNESQNMATSAVDNTIHTTTEPVDENMDVGPQDFSNSSDVWDPALKEQIVLDKKFYDER